MLLWLMLGLACGVLPLLAERHRRTRRLNAALHELRRPLQLLALGGAHGRPDQRCSESALELLCEATADLDRAINGVGSEAGELRPRPVSSLAAVLDDAQCRWATVPGVSFRDLGHGRPVRLDRTAAAQALDNLVANALEHGAGPVEVLAGGSRAELIEVVNPLPSGRRPRADGARRDRRRGHGLRLAREAAARAGARLEGAVDEREARFRVLADSGSRE